MKHLILIVVIALTLGALHGCGSRSQHNDAGADKLGDGPGQLDAEAHSPSNAQIERDGLPEPGTTRIDETSGLTDETIQDPAGQQARVLRRQAELLEQIEGYTVRFDVAVDALMDAGSIDPASMKTVGDIDERIAMIAGLEKLNERLDTDLPPLFRELGRIEGRPAEIERQLVTIAQIRALDRRMFGDMVSALGILRVHWDKMVFQGDGQGGVAVLFGSQMPDNELNRYNALIDRIQKGATSEAKLQQQLLEL